MRTSTTAPGPFPNDGAPGPYGAGTEAAGWTRRLLRFGYRPGARRGVRERLVPPFPAAEGRVGAWLGLAPRAAVRLARWSAWGGPLLVAAFAGVLRFVGLSRPHDVVFDETYYAKDAWALLHHGHETSWPDDADARILTGEVPLTDTASYVVHPPLGKWIIAIGEWTFGMNPFGWRFMVALLGAVSVLMLCRIGRRLFRSTALGCLAGLLMALDGLHFVMSRTALLDPVLMFWVLAAFGCLLLDRDRSRARLASALARQQPDGNDDRVLRPVAAVGQRLALGLRPWRLAAGFCLGLACATKWSGLYFVAAFGLLIVLWDVAARRTAGAPRPLRAMLRRDAAPAFLATVPVAAATYLASWAGWFASSTGYYRDHAAASDTPGDTGGWMDAVLSWVHYHREAYDFHVALDEPHSYESNPFSWLVMGRPVSFFYESAEEGEGSCQAAGGCASEVLALGTPVLWWTGCLALAYAVCRWLLGRDWRAGAVLCGLAAGFLPWFVYQDRTIFSFYAVVMVPFLCLAVALMLGALMGPPGSAERRRTVGIVVAGLLVLAVAWNFVYFYPLYTALEIPMEAWRARMWLPSWI